MKNLIKITKYFITLFWLGLNCSILKGEIEQLSPSQNSVIKYLVILFKFFIFINFVLHTNPEGI